MALFLKQGIAGKSPAAKRDRPGPAFGKMAAGRRFLLGQTAFSGKTPGARQIGKPLQAGQRKGAAENHTLRLENAENGVKMVCKPSPESRKTAQQS